MTTAWTWRTWAEDQGPPSQVHLYHSTFQNPTGVCLSNDRRQRMAELAAQYRVFILEDDPYCELRYLGDPQPSIMSFDQRAWSSTL